MSRAVVFSVVFGGVFLAALMVAPVWLGVAAAVVWPLVMIYFLVQVVSSGSRPENPPAPPAPRVSATVDGATVKSVEVLPFVAVNVVWLRMSSTQYEAFHELAEVILADPSLLEVLDRLFTFDPRLVEASLNAVHDCDGLAAVREVEIADAV